jgi:uncharacterized protein (DUF305 family)
MEARCPSARDVRPWGCADDLPSLGNGGGWVARQEDGLVTTALIDEPQDTAQATTVRRARTSVLVVGVALLALVGGLLLGRGMNSGPVEVSDAVSIGFLQDMKVHHAQAVEMSEIVHRRSSDPELNYLAFDILSTQQGQIGIMTGWLDLWGARQSATGPVMGWMGHDGPMPGMATAEQIVALESMPVAEMEREFLQLMLAHHRGALDMAKAAADHAESGDVAALAHNMYTGQSAEIALMERMLVERGAVPATGAEHHGH